MEIILSREHRELRNLLTSDIGKDFLPSLPLIESQIESAAILGILKQWCRGFIAAAERKLECKICFVAFGSLGRLEFVRTLSDLDPLIIVKSAKSTPIHENEVRAAILGPLARANSWLAMDNRDDVVAGEWENLPGVDLKYPVLTVEDLQNGQDQLTRQRRWQLLLESRPLYNEDMFKEVSDSLLPQQPIPYPRRSREQIVDFEQLVEHAPQIFAPLENPTFLYKSPFKYWKARILREFYVFATSLYFVLGWYRQQRSEALDYRYLRSSTATKIMRSTEFFAGALDKRLMQNTYLRGHYDEQMKDLLTKHKIKYHDLMAYGEPYSTGAARLLHGLFAHLLSWFASCWGKSMTQMYERLSSTSLRIRP